MDEGESVGSRITEGMSVLSENQPVGMEAPMREPVRTTRETERFEQELEWVHDALGREVRMTRLNRWWVFFVSTEQEALRARRHRNDKKRGKPGDPLVGMHERAKCIATVPSIAEAQEAVCRDIKRRGRMFRLHFQEPSSADGWVRAAHNEHYQRWQPFRGPFCVDDPHYFAVRGA